MKFPWMIVVAIVLASGWSDGDALAQGKKKKKKKDAAAAEGGEAAEGGDAASGGRLHAKQGVDAPYKGLIGVSTFRFGSGSGEVTPEEGDATKVSNSDLKIDVEYLLILMGGKIGVGPMFSYESTSETTEQTVTTATGTDTDNVETKDSELGFGLSARFFITDLNKDVFVPFVGLQFEITSGTQVQGEDDETTSSGTRIGLQGGSYFFVTPHAALSFGLVYQLENETEKNKRTSSVGTTSTTVESEDKDKTTVLGLLFGLSGFI